MHYLVPVVCAFTTLIVGHVSVTVLPLRTLVRRVTVQLAMCMVPLLSLVRSQQQFVPQGCGMVYDSVAPGMCMPCGLLSLTMCFMSAPVA